MPNGSRLVGFPPRSCNRATELNLRVFVCCTSSDLSRAFGLSEVAAGRCLTARGGLCLRQRGGQPNGQPLGKKSHGSTLEHEHYSLKLLLLLRSGALSLISIPGHVAKVGGRGQSLERSA